MPAKENITMMTVMMIMIMVVVVVMMSSSEILDFLLHSSYCFSQHG
jgi:hypothetical protein